MGILVSIPQAVSAVATKYMKKMQTKHLNSVSIPQAVSAVATVQIRSWANIGSEGFNTASGKCCCNSQLEAKMQSLFFEFQYRKR